MKPNRQKDNTEFQPEVLGEIPMTIARFATWGGAIAFAGSLFVTIYLMTVASGDAAKANQVATNMELFQKGMVTGVLCFVRGTAWLFWEEEVMVAGHLIGSLLLMFSPTILPLVISFNNNPGVQAGYAAMNGGAMLWLGMAAVILVTDISLRVKNRMVHGTKAELLKYGNKSMKEESDRKNVFMGKCWQLPYCRKYVREKCPIFHAQRTCWREQVGCMCEESVIRSAIENKPVSKEALLSGAAIPRNNKLSTAAKKERCKTCVIYNEHQKHKYRLAMPSVFIFYTLFYALFRIPLSDMVNRMLGGTSKVISNVTVGTVQKVETGAWFTQILVAALLITALAYTIKMIEYAIFKLKI